MGKPAVVGAYFADVAGNTDQGAAYTFYRDLGGTDARGQVTKPTAADGAAGDVFGWSVSTKGDTTIVGAPCAEVGGNTHQGAAYVFALLCSISGQVVDAGDNPMAGVTLSATGGYTVTTDVGGIYTFTNLLPATYTVTPTLEGYSFDPFTRTVDVPPDATGQSFEGERILFKVYLPLVVRNRQ